MNKKESHQMNSKNNFKQIKELLESSEDLKFDQIEELLQILSAKVEKIDAGFFHCSLWELLDESNQIDSFVKNRYDLETSDFDEIQENLIFANSFQNSLLGEAFESLPYPCKLTRDLKQSSLGDLLELEEKLSELNKSF